MNKVTIREYRSGDSEKIYKLFSEHTPYKRDAEFWVWLNRMLSDQKSIIVVAVKENELIGHYAVIPQTININNDIYSSGLAIHAFIHPDHRNGFLIFQITKKMYKLAKSRNIDFIYGFPNKNFRDIQIKADKWIEISLFNSLEKTNLDHTDTNFSLVSCSTNYQDVYTLSEVIDKTDISENIHIKKSLNYYINRYLNHPQAPYQNFFIKNNSEIIGFVCLKTYEENGIKSGHIIDYLVTETNSFNDIIKVTENYFHKKAEKLSFWKFDEKTKSILLKNGFNENGFETFFGIKMLDDNKELEKQLSNFTNWDLCMGDSDAF